MTSTDQNESMSTEQKILTKETVKSISLASVIGFPVYASLIINIWLGLWK